MESETLNQINQRLSNIETLLLTNKTVLNLDEVATLTGLSKSHLYKMSHTGNIPCYRPTGGRLHFDKAEIEKWLLQGKKKTNAEIEIEAATAVTLKK